MKKILLLLFISIAAIGQSTLSVNHIVNSGYSSNYQNVLNYSILNNWSVPTPSVRSLQDAFFKGIMTDGGGAKLSHLKIVLGDGSLNFTNINWINPGNANTVHSGGPSYVINDGIYGNGINQGSYSDTRFIPANDGVKFTQDNAEFITFFKSVPSAASAAQHGIFSNPLTRIVPFSTSTQVQFDVNDNGAGFLTGNDLNEGLYFVGRTDASNHFYKKNNGSRQSTAHSSTGLSTYSFLMDAVNNAGTVQNQSSQTWYLFAAGALLTTTEETNFYNYWQTYMAGIRALTLPPTVGTFYSKSSFTGTDLTNDFTTNGATVSVVSNKLRFSGGANTYTQSLNLTSIAGTNIGNSLAMKWTETIGFVVPTLTSTSYWIGTGLDSKNQGGTGQDLILWMNTSNSGTGVMKITQGVNRTVVATSSALTINAGETITMTFSRNINMLSYSAFSSAAPATIVSGTLDMWTDADHLNQPNVHQFAIFNGSTDNIDVSSWNVTIDEYYQPNLCILGDSKTAGFRANQTQLNGYAFIIKAARSPQTVVLGGPSDNSNDLVTVMYQICNVIKPKYLFLGGLSNDPRAGLSGATTHTNLTSIVSQAEAAGITVILCTGLYETNISQTSIQTEMNTNFSTKIIIDLLSIVLTLADTIHPDDAGGILFGNKCLATGKIPIY